MNTNKMLTWTIVTIVSLLAIFSFTLSYDNMRHLAQEHGKYGWRGNMWPILIDGCMIAFALIVVYLSRQDRSSRLARWLVFLFTVATVYFNIAVSIGVPSQVNTILVAVSPPIVLFFTFEALMDMLKHTVSNNVKPKIDKKPTVSSELSKSVKTPVDTFTERQQTLVNLIKDNVTSVSKLAELSSVSRQTVYKELDTLKEQGVIHKNGKGWEITY